MEHSTYSRGTLKKRLLRDGILKEECAICGITEWRGQPAPMDLDHINGIHDDNRLENLRILCAMCHRQTETHGGKNIKGRKPPRTCPECDGHISYSAKKCAKCTAKRTIPSKSLICPSCQGRKSSKSSECRSCSNKSRISQSSDIYPPVSELVELVEKVGYLRAGKILGVTDNAVRKHLRNRGIDPKTVKKISKSSRNL